MKVSLPVQNASGRWATRPKQIFVAIRAMWCSRPNLNGHKQIFFSVLLRTILTTCQSIFSRVSQTVSQKNLGHAKRLTTLATRPKAFFGSARSNMLSSAPRPSRYTRDVTYASDATKSNACTHLPATTAKTVASHLRFFASRLPSRISHPCVAAQIAGPLRHNISPVLDSAATLDALAAHFTEVVRRFGPERDVHALPLPLHCAQKVFGRLSDRRR
jgi:hypothetical protein